MNRLHTRVDVSQRTIVGWIKAVHLVLVSNTEPKTQHDLQANTDQTPQRSLLHGKHVFIGMEELAAGRHYCRGSCHLLSLAAVRRWMIGIIMPITFISIDDGSVASEMPILEQHVSISNNPSLLVQSTYARHVWRALLRWLCLKIQQIATA